MTSVLCGRGDLTPRSVRSHGVKSPRPHAYRLLPSNHGETRRLRPGLGTFVEIRVAAETSDPQRAIETGFSAIALVHEKMSPRVSTSDVSRLRRSAAGEILQVHPWTWEVLSAAQLFAAWSNGAFDPTLSRGSQNRGAWQDFETLPSSRILVRRPIPQLDLGGIAKGFAVDRAVAALRSGGAQSGVVNAGGDLRAFGSTAQPLLIRDPRTPCRTYDLGVVQDDAIATSTNASDPPGSGRLLRAAGRRLWIGRGSASVRATSCLIADALCKVVATVGPKAAQSLLEMCNASTMVIARGEMILVGNFHRAA